MDVEPAAREAPPRGGRRWAYAALLLWVVAADVWFQGPFLGDRVPPSVAPWLLLALAALILVALAPIRAFGARSGASPLPGRDGLTPARPADGRPDAERRAPHFAIMATAGMLVLATLVRLPALVAPGSLISSDSAVAGIIAQELRAGQAPPPIYAPGFPYEGTLKPHLTALLGAALPFAGTPLLYTLASHLFFLGWIAAVMVLARRVAGTAAALGAGAFLAVSPRFLAAFSLNNVGQYPEVNALGAAGLAALVAGGGPLAAGFLVGLALWQQLVAISFVAVLALALLLTPEWRRPRRAAEALAGVFAGSYPMWAWNAANGWATFDFFRRGGKNPWDRLAGVPERLERTAAVSFPKMFGLTDLGTPDVLAAALGLVLPVLVVAMAWARRRELVRARGKSAVFLAVALAAVTLGVFVVSKFSHRGVQRPRYLIPLYTPVGMAVGWAVAALARRSPPLAGIALGGVLAVNVAGLVPWLRARADAAERDRAFLDRLAQLGVRTGYAGFWVGPKYTFLSEGRVVLSGELGPVVSWVHPPHAAQVRERGPDALVAGRGALANALAARLDALGARYKREEVAGHAVFHSLSRRISLEELAGYDTGLPPPTSSGDTPDDAVREEVDTTS